MIKLAPSNDRIKHIKKLARKHEREKCGEFVIEGKRSVYDAAANGADISYVIFCESDTPMFGDFIPQFYTDKKTFAEITDTESPQDVLAVAKMRLPLLDEVISKKPDIIVMCDRVRDPGNIGTIIRTADAVGNAAVLLSEGSADLFNPKVIRSTMSSIFNLPIVKDVLLSDAIEALKLHGYKIICGALKENSVGLYEADLSGPCVVIIGNEGTGVSDEIIALCGKTVKIPMRGKAESLNAAVSAGILMYEILRQNMK